MKNKKYGSYTGKYLRVNLTDKKINLLDTPNDLIENYLGGNGFGTKILWDEVPPVTDAFDPENKIIFATGALTGTSWPSSGRLEVVTKSPLTGIYGDSNCGGFFAPKLKEAGYDMIVVEGKSSNPLYLSINGNNVELKDATNLWGKEISLTIEMIKKELYDSNSEIASIGPAGENLVRFASIGVGKNRTLARSGIGAVMGSKKLKAIAVTGGKKTSIYDVKEFKKTALKAFKSITKSDSIQGLHEYGTSALVSFVDNVGRFPTRNFQAGNFEEVDKISGVKLKRDHFVKHLSTCYNCPISCDKLVEVKKGEYKGSTSSSLEYETICSLGSKCGNSNLESIIKGNSLCDELGMDTISVGGVISWAMECYEKGILTKKELDDTDLSWGNHKSIIKFLEKIAHRKGIGNLMAEGTKKASEKIGKGSEKYAMHVKGMEIPSQDGRSQQSMGLAQVTSSRGADHLKGFPTIDELGYVGPASERYGKDKLPEIVDGIKIKYKPFVVKDGEDFCAVIDSCGVCKFGTLFPPEIYWNELAEGIRYASGLDIDGKKLKKIGERIYNLQRCYNVLCGVSKKDDTLPSRLLKEPSPSKRAKGHVVYLNKMLPEYYQIRGWNKNTGYPTTEKLKELGLDFVVEKLIKYKKL